MARNQPEEAMVLSASTLTWTSLAGLAATLGVYVLYLLAMAGFLAICGASRTEIAKWALKQADRQHLTNLIRAARGLPVGDVASGDQNSR